MAQHRPRRRHVAILQILRQPIGIDLAADPLVEQQRSELRGEAQRAVGVLGHEQRLLAQAVTREDQLAGALVPEGQSEHAVQLGDEPVAVLLVGVCDDLAVGLGREPVTGPLQTIAQLAKAVDLAVEDDVHGPRLVVVGLVAAGDVDYRQPADRQRDPIVVVDPRFIGPAVGQIGGDALQDRSALSGFAR